jgi:CHAD domain-containing protein
MKKNLLNYYVVDLFRSIEQNLYNYREDKKPESIHSLRVDIKKIKALFSFVKKVYKENYKTNKLKALFRKAGKIREIEINIHLLLAFSNPPKRLINQLKKKENALTQQYLKSIPYFIKLIKKYRKGVSLPGKMPNRKAVKKYFKNEKQKANKKLQNKDRESAHRYRMILKELLYIYNVLPKNLQKEIEFNETEINTLQMKLGDWHDTYSIIKFLSHQNLYKKLSKYILKLKEKESREFNALFKE